MANEKEIKFKVTVNGKEAVATLETIEDVLAKLKNETETTSDDPFFDNVGGKALALNQSLQALKESKLLLNQTFGEAIRVYDANVQSTLKLEAASKITGIELDKLTSISAQSKDEFSLSERASNEFTISLSKLTAKAGDVSQTSAAIKDLLNVAAAQGLNSDQALVAINQAILGIDEGTDKLFQKNPAVIYQEYAAAIGTTAGKLTDAQKAQAIMNELQEVSVKVGDTYLSYLDSEAGKQAAFNSQLEETQAAIGGVVRAIAGPFLQVGKSWLELFNQLPDSMQGTLGTLALLLISLKTLQATGIIPNLGLLTILRTQLGIVSVALRTGAGSAAVFSAGMTVATTTVRAFFASIPIVGWIALLLSSLPLLYDFAKSWLGIGDEIAHSTEKLNEFDKKLRSLTRFEVETNLADTTTKITALEAVISSFQQKLLRDRTLGREGRKELTEQIGLAQESLSGLKSEAELLQNRLAQLDSAKPGQEGFRSLTQRVEETEKELKKIAELSVDGLIPESEKKRALELKNELIELRKQKELLFKELGLSEVNIPVKPEVEPVQAKDIIIDAPELKPIELEVVISRFPDFSSVESELKGGLITSLATVNEALSTLNREFENAATDEARQKIHSLKQALTALSAEMKASGTSTEELGAKLEAGLIKTSSDIETALQGLNELLAVTFDEQKIAQIQALIAQLQELSEKLKTVSKKATLDFGPVLATAISDVAAAFGEMLASGENSTQTFGVKVMGALASAMKTIGGMILSLGINIAAVEANPNPLLWIAGGAALIAAGSLIAAQVNNALRKETQGNEQTIPKQRFAGYWTGGIPETRQIIEVAEEGPEMILSAPATEKLRPFFNVLNQGMLPTIPVPHASTPSLSANINVAVDGGFKVSGNDLLSVLTKRIKIEKALGRDVLS